MKVVTRYPPSPTGEIHIGNMRTMLFNYLWAKKHNGEVVLRFEDTDSERSDAKFETTAIEAFCTLGIEPDRGPFRQSERTSVYCKQLEQLIAEGKAYEGEESSDESGNRVVRFKNPNTTITFVDHVRGEISIDTSDFGDFVIARSINDPIYHFTVVVDDLEMGVTHILRGEDHITSTPRQILLIEALGGARPEYAHLPLIIGEDKKKLSKRHGAVTVKEFTDNGYLPSAIVNYLAFLGWNPGDEREIFTLEELIQEFSLEKINKSPATFTYTKLNDINRQHMLRLETSEVIQGVIEHLPPATQKLFDVNPDVGEKLIELVLIERISTYGDVVGIAQQGELDMFFTRPAIDYNLVRFKDESVEHGQVLVGEAVAKLQELNVEVWNKETVTECLWEWSGEVGRGSLLHPMRTVLSGSKKSPDPFTIAAVIGKEETIARLQAFV